MTAQTHPITQTLDPNLYQAAQHAIGALLDGAAPNGTQPADLGPFREVFAEMIAAHSQAGTDGARRIFAAYAKAAPDVAALRAGDGHQGGPRAWTVADLLQTTFPDPVWAVPDLLPAGLAVLGGRPKTGKSWLALQTAVAVGAGGKVLGRDVKRGRVLYLALEDNPRRLKDRLQKQQASGPEDITFQFEWQPLSTPAGVDALVTAIQSAQYSLIVIDTLTRAMGSLDQMDGAQMGMSMGLLQQVALKSNVCLLFLDHHRKPAASVQDVIDDIAGSTAKTGVADAALGLYRDRGGKAAILKATGRDLDDQELAIVFDPVTFCWQYQGTSADVKAETVQADIMAVIDAKGGQATSTEIAKELNKRLDHISREIQELVKKGKLVPARKIGREQPYRLTNHVEDEGDETPDRRHGLDY